MFVLLSVNGLKELPVIVIFPGATMLAVNESCIVCAPSPTVVSWLAVPNILNDCVGIFTDVELVS